MTRFKVKLAKGKPEFIVADYYKIEAGVITFRFFGLGGQYPIFVKCFAAGTWHSVENNSLMQLRKAVGGESK